MPIAEVTLQPMRSDALQRWLTWEIICSEEALRITRKTAADPVESLAALQVAGEMMVGWALGDMNWAAGLSTKEAGEEAHRIVREQSCLNAVGKVARKLSPAFIEALT